MSLWNVQLCPMCERPRSSTPCPTCGNVAPPEREAKPPAEVKPPAETKPVGDVCSYRDAAADDPRYGGPRDEDPPATPVIEERVPEVADAPPPAPPVPPVPPGLSAEQKAWLAEYLEKVRKEQTLLFRVKSRVKNVLEDLMLYWPVVLCGLGIVLILLIGAALGLRGRQEIQDELRSYR